MILKHCPIRNVLDSLASKWPLLVLHSLSAGKPMYFGELRRSIPDVSPKMLSAALKLLVEEEIITRTVVPVVPPRTLYALTSHGEELLQAIEPLLQWAVNHMRRKSKPTIFT
ncbi:MAG: helix-turn-helix transcriptional regulator [Bacteroidales bacterium]|nr:helix-turn-helix transcriptional regulator [Bacteroidales bacterium]